MILEVVCVQCLKIEALKCVVFSLDFIPTCHVFKFKILNGLRIFEVSIFVVIFTEIVFLHPNLGL